MQLKTCSFLSFVLIAILFSSTEAIAVPKLSKSTEALLTAKKALKLAKKNKNDLAFQKGQISSLSDQQGSFGSIIVNNNIPVLQGPQGPVGPQGPQGPAGQSGSNGANGSSGSSGSTSDKMIFEVYNPNTTSWTCVDVYLEDECGDIDGCRIRVNMQHETNKSDQVKNMEAVVYIENSALSNNNGEGLSGHLRAFDGEKTWVSGTTKKYGIWSPYGWISMLNYRHKNCGTESQGYTGINRYKFTFMVPPYIRATVIVTD